MIRDQLPKLRLVQGADAVFRRVLASVLETLDVPVLWVAQMQKKLTHTRNTNDNVFLKKMIIAKR